MKSTLKHKIENIAGKHRERCGRRCLQSHCMQPGRLGEGPKTPLIGSPRALPASSRLLICPGRDFFEFLLTRLQCLHAASTLSILLPRRHTNPCKSLSLGFLSIHSFIHPLLCMLTYFITPRSQSVFSYTCFQPSFSPSIHSRPQNRPARDRLVLGPPQVPLHKLLRTSCEP